MASFHNPFRHTSLEFRIINLGIAVILLLVFFHLFHYTNQHRSVKASYVQQMAQKHLQTIALLVQTQQDNPPALLLTLRRFQLNNPEVFYIGLAREGDEFLHATQPDRTFTQPPLYLSMQAAHDSAITLHVVFDQEGMQNRLEQPLLPLYKILAIGLLSTFLFILGVWLATASLRRTARTLYYTTAKEEETLPYTPNEALLLERCFHSITQTNQLQQSRLEMLNLHFEELIDAKTSSLKAEVRERTETQKNLEISNQEKTILLKEVHHRVKNNLAVIAGLIRMQSRRITDPKSKSMFTDLQNRIKTMELIHTNLYTSKTFNKINMRHYLASLAQNLNKTFPEECETITFFVSCDELLLEIDQAITCGQLVNELVTNAFKHAFKEKEEGHIWVSMKEIDGVVELRVEDSGKNTAQGTPKSFSLGLSLVHELTKYQLKGKVEVQNEGGLRYCITFKK